MKLLLFYSPAFWWEPFSKALPDAEEAAGRHRAEKCLVAFIHAESTDEGQPGRAVTKAVKNIKWLARKFETPRVILHYFSHLSTDKAPPVLARGLVEEMADRLASVGYQVIITPYGYTCSWGMEVAGESLGRVFVDIPSESQNAGEPPR
jgi:hypothetical protein